MIDLLAHLLMWGLIMFVGTFFLVFLLELVRDLISWAREK